MQKINQKAGLVFDQLTKGMAKIGDHKKIENKPYMALCIEVIGKQGANGLQISFCHYGEQNGDAMRDPEVCFIMVPGVDNKGIWAPYYYRNDYLGVEQFAVDFDDNGAIESFKPKMQKDIATFSGIWAANLKDQGFIEAVALPAKLPPMAIIDDYDPETESSEKEVCYYETEPTTEPTMRPRGKKEVTVRELLGDDQIAIMEANDLAHMEGKALVLHLPALNVKACEGKEFDDYPQEYAFAREA
jgi:hypothetical protein